MTRISPSDLEVREALAYADTRRFFKDTNSRFLVILADALEDTQQELDGTNREWANTLEQWRETIAEMHARELHHFETEKALIEAKAWLDNPHTKGMAELDRILSAALSDVKEEEK